MIIFHEGLPRSGKSYEATIQMVDWLKEGKKVITNIAGIDHAKFAELTGLPLSVVKMLLIQISNGDVQKIWETIPLPNDDGTGGEKDLNIVLDELQDFFPSERNKPPKELSTWVASHGHAGWHILAMGQDLRDVHNLFRRRVQRKIVFTKMTAVGLENSYKWEAYEALRPEKFKAIGSGTKKYDKQYFGAYQSHVEGTTNTTAHMDDRAIIWKRPGFKYGLPAALAVAVFAVNSLINFFSPPEPETPPTAKTQPTKPNPQNQQVRAANQNQQRRANSQHRNKNQNPKGEKQELQPIDYVDNMANSYKFRLSGILYNEEKTYARIDVLDKTFHLKESFSISDLKGMGWEVNHYSYGIVINKKAKGRVARHVVRPWPIDPFGRVSDRQRNSKEMSTTNSF